MLEAERAEVASAGAAPAHIARYVFCFDNPTYFDTTRLQSQIQELQTVPKGANDPLSITSQIKRKCCKLCRSVVSCKSQNWYKLCALRKLMQLIEPLHIVHIEQSKPIVQIPIFGNQQHYANCVTNAE
jgi:hypothetical protein